MFSDFKKWGAWTKGIVKSLKLRIPVSPSGILFQVSTKKEKRVPKN